MSKSSNGSRHLVAIGLLALVGASCGGDAADSTTTDAPVATDTPTTDAPATGAPATGTPVTEGPSTTDAPVATDPAPQTTGSSDASAAAATGLLRVTEVDFATGIATITNVGAEPYELVGHWICNRPEYEELPTDTLDPGESVETGFGGFSPDGGELAVYSSRDFDSSDAILAYVTWGAAGGRLSVAEAAGLWSGDPVVPTGDVITLTGDAVTADGWSG